MSVTGVFYRSVIDDVVNSIRETFLDDGVDEQVLLELKQIWENKLLQSKAVPPENVPVELEQPAVPQFTIPPQQQQHTTTTTAAATAATTTTTTPQSQATSVIPPNLQYHYTTAGQGGGGNEVPKSVTFTLPQTVGGNQKPVTITLPPHLMQSGLMMSSPAAAAAQALPANMAAGLLHTPMGATVNHAGVIAHRQAGGATTMSYQALTAEQLAKQGYVLSMSQGVTTAATTSTTTLAQQQIHATQAGGIIQLDGANDTSDDEDDDDDDLKDDENDQDDDEQNEDENEGIGEEEEPLNSEDDVSDEDPSELFDTDNVIVCQYDKITRSRNKWKFHLKDGIMNLQGRDFVFQKASGDAEW